MKFDNPFLETIFSYPPYKLDPTEKESLLLDSVIYELGFHYNKNRYIRKYYDRNNIRLNEIRSIHELPFIPASVFKELGELLVSIEDSKIISDLRSSATSGIPSLVRLDKETSRRQVKALGLILADRLGKSRRPFLVMDINPLHANLKTIGARGAAVKGFLNLASQAYYLLSELPEGLVFNEDFFQEIIGSFNNQPIILFGFTYVIYSELLEKFAGKNTSFCLPAGSMFVHIGGWKKLEDKQISRENFNAQVNKLLGISNNNIIDFYGFTEQMGVSYPDCECGWKHTPNFSEITIRNVVNLDVVPEGEEGLIQLSTPIPHSYPGNVILTDDIGYIARETEELCSYGRNGTRFKIIGRTKQSEPRGCGDIMADKIYHPAAYTGNESKKIELVSTYSDKSQDIDIARLKSLIIDRKKSQEWLRNQNVDLLIGLIDKVAQKWASSQSGLNEYKNQGLSFLCNWSRAENLKLLVESSLGNRYFLDRFTKVNDVQMKLLKAMPLGLAVHWLSGNVPLLGFLVLIQAIITKNSNIIKISHNSSEIFSKMIRHFENTTYTSPGGEVIAGNDLLKTVSIIYIDKANEMAAKLLSSNADIRIAWGGQEAVSTISNLPKKYTAEDIIFGPKLSFMVIGKEALRNDRKLKRLVKNAAIDSSVFDQTGCSSPHNIFIEKGGDISPSKFAELLSLEMDKISKRIPNTEKDPDILRNIKLKRTIHQFIGDLWTSSDHSWTILLDDEVKLASPTYGRVINIKSIDSIEQTLEFIDMNIQTIGIALTGKKKISYCEKAASLGADRFPEIGRMTYFEDPWDGMMVMQRCIKWKSLGGPF